jgi:hypothetical protein
LLLAGTAWFATGSFTPVNAQDDDDAKRGVARISLINGEVSVRRGDSGDWVAAAVNAPVMAQDRLTTGPTSRTEVQFDWANMLRIGANAELQVAQLEYRRYILQLARGTVTFRVLRDSDADVELDTPSVSVRPSRRGVYRVTVRDDGTTEVAVRAGDVEVFTPRGSQRLTAGQSLEARGTQSDPEFQIAGATPIDDWDRWNEARDRALEQTQAYRYVSRDVYGAEDLDPYGTWVYDAPYGYVWRPTVVAGWAPYRHGRWSWVDWYGWTWVSYDPWGWAPYHYGRWYSGPRGWCWYPGGIGGRHHWSPALVAFFGFGRGVSVGVGFGGGWGNVGWVPLAPHERFSPWWGRSYYGGYRNGAYIDRSVNITNVNITNVYRNSRVTNGVTAINSGDFSRGRFNNYVRVDHSNLQQASLSRGMMPAVPGDAHLRYSDRQVRNAGSSSRIDNTRFYSRQQVQPVQRVSFNEQRQGLERVSRVPVSERTSMSNSPGRAESPAARQQSGGPSGNDGRGWRRVGESTPSNTGSAPSGDNRGFRRSEQQGGGNPATPPQGAGSQASPGRSGSQGQGGWRRFNENGSGSGPQAPSGGSPQAAPRMERQQSSSPSGSGSSDPAPNRSSGRGGWQRFGDPGSGNQQAAPRNDRSNSPSGQPQSGQSQSGQSRSWNRFGDPGSSRSSGSSSTASPQRYERRSVSPSQAPPPQYNAPSRQESNRIAPPVVRERSNSGPSRQAAPSQSRSESRYTGGGSSSGRGGGGGGNSSHGGGGRSDSGGRGDGGGGRGGRGR